MARRTAVTQTGEIVVRGGTLVDETGERRGDVLVREGRIVAVEEAIEAPKGATVLDAGGCVVVARSRRPARPLARARWGNRRDGRVRLESRRPRWLHGRRRHAEHRACHRLGRRRPRRARARGDSPGRDRRGGRDHDRPAGRTAGSDGRARRARRAAVHRRRARRAARRADAPRARVRLGARCRARRAL